MIRWPGKVPAGRVSNEIVHGVDLFPTLASLCDAKVPTDRPIDGMDESGFFEGKSDKSPREGFPIWVDNRLQAVKWRNYKAHFYQQDTMVSPPLRLGIPQLFDLYANPQEDPAKPFTNSWVAGPIFKIIGQFEASVRSYPLIPMGTPEPYDPTLDAKK